MDVDKTSDIRYFVFSSELFAGFKVSIDLEDVKSLDDITSICTATLFQTLVNHNFKALLERAQTAIFHIHGYSLEDMKSSRTTKFYICDHPHGETSGRSLPEEELRDIFSEMGVIPGSMMDYHVE